MTKQQTDAIQTLRQTRQNFLRLIDAFSLEQLNHTPTSYNNNLIWNFAHVIVTHQRLCYGLSNLPMLVDEDMNTNYMKGSSPEQTVTKEQLDYFKHLAVKTIDQMEKDFELSKFKEFRTYPTSYGLKLTNIDEAMSFNNLHESMHYGFSKALAKHI